jgi:hypothetical protein
MEAVEADLLAGAVGRIHRGDASGIAPDSGHADDTVGSLASLFGVPPPPHRWRSCAVAPFAATHWAGRGHAGATSATRIAL